MAGCAQRRRLPLLSGFHLCHDTFGHQVYKEDTLVFYATVCEDVTFLLGLCRNPISERDDGATHETRPSAGGLWQAPTVTMHAV